MAVLPRGDAVTGKRTAGGEAEGEPRTRPPSKRLTTEFGDRAGAHVIRGLRPHALSRVQPPPCSGWISRPAVKTSGPWGRAELRASNSFRWHHRASHEAADVSRAGGNTRAATSPRQTPPSGGSPPSRAPSGALPNERPGTIRETSVASPTPRWRPRRPTLPPPPPPTTAIARARLPGTPPRRRRPTTTLSGFANPPAARCSAGGSRASLRVRVHRLQSRPPSNACGTGAG